MTIRNSDGGRAPSLASCSRLDSLKNLYGHCIGGRKFLGKVSPSSFVDNEVGLLGPSRFSTFGVQTGGRGSPVTSHPPRFLWDSDSSCSGCPFVVMGPEEAGVMVEWVKSDGRGIRL